jgi:hypothetical protein
MSSRAAGGVHSSAGAPASAPASASYLLVEQGFAHGARGPRDGRHGLGGVVGHCWGGRAGVRACGCNWSVGRARGDGGGGAVMLTWSLPVTAWQAGAVRATSDGGGADGWVAQAQTFFDPLAKSTGRDARLQSAATKRFCEATTWHPYRPYECTSLATPLYALLTRARRPQTAVRRLGRACSR